MNQSHISSLYARIVIGITFLISLVCAFFLNSFVVPLLVGILFFRIFFFSEHKKIDIFLLVIYALGLLIVGFFYVSTLHLTSQHTCVSGDCYGVALMTYAALGYLLYVLLWGLSTWAYRRSYKIVFTVGTLLIALTLLSLVINNYY